MADRLKRHLPTQRRLIQLYAALLYNAHAKGFLTGKIYTGNLKFLCVPGLNCYSCPGAAASCPLGALQNALAVSGAGIPTYILGILLLFGITLGRTICGYLCPMGLLQELLHKIPSPKIKKSRATRQLSALKYIVLAVFVVLLPLWYAAAKQYPLPAFCKYLCPAGTLEGAVGLLAHPANSDLFFLLGGLFTWKVFVLAAILLLCVFLYRGFCRFLCPLGALYGLFSKINLVGVKVEAPKCIDCGKCVECCPMDIRHVGDHECIHCGKCISPCPTGAISFKAGSAVLHGPEPKPHPRRRAALWCVALVLLAGLFWFVNRPEPAIDPPAPPLLEDLPVLEELPSPEPTPPEEAGTPVGKEVGMLAPEFAVAKYAEGGGVFYSTDVNPGKTLVVNFWATWCGPCLSELPDFDHFDRDYADLVEVVAVHSHMVGANVRNFLAEQDYQMTFGLDGDGEVIASFGGSTMLPHTVIIDPEGVILYNAVGPMTYEDLEGYLP